MHKIGRLRIYLLLIVALFLQGGFLDRVKIMGAKPDLLLMAVVFFGLFLGPGAGFESGFIAGLLKDIFALDFLWINAAILGMAGFLAGAVNTQFFKESKRADFLFASLFTLFSMSLHYLIVSFLSRSMALNFTDFFMTSAIPAAIYTGLVSIPVYLKLQDLFNLKEAADYL